MALTCRCWFFTARNRDDCLHACRWGGAALRDGRPTQNLCTRSPRGAFTQSLGMAEIKKYEQ